MIYKNEIQKYLQESSCFEKLENQSAEISEICEKIILSLRVKIKFLFMVQQQTLNTYGCRICK